MRTTPRSILSALLLTACTVGTMDPDAGQVVDAMSDAGMTDAGGGAICGEHDTLGDPCTSSGECNDGCFCNGIEICMEGACAHIEPPCEDGFECTADVCDETTDTCDPAPDHAQCADDNVCNGTELCVPGVGCAPGPRMTCTDDDPCTIGTCDPSAGCSFAIRDLDADGHTDERCGGDDCNDDPGSGAGAHPGATEICDNGLDDDCNGTFDFYELGCRATNDTCTTAEMLPGPGSFVRTTRGATSQYPLSCFPGGVDAVFRFHLDAPQDVSAGVELSTSGAAALAIRRAGSCDTGPDIECGSAVATRELEPGDYVVIVRSNAGATFTLTLAFGAPSEIPASDTCGPATSDVTAGGTFSGFFSDVEHDYELACNRGTLARDAAYRLVLTETSDVRVSASTSAGTPATTFLSLTRDCANVASNIACVQGGEPEIVRRSLPAGTYFVLVESAHTAALTWRLDVDVTRAAPRNEGDSCTTPIDVTDAMATVSLGVLELDTGTGCGGDNPAFRDATFSITTTTERDVIVTSDPAGPHYISMSPICGDRAAETFCGSGSPTFMRRFVRVPAGTYYLTVATTLAAGDLTVTTRTEPPTLPPVNDACASATDLTNAVLARGNLTTAADDLLGCGGTGAPDAVHRLVLTERRSVTLSARRTDGSGEPLSIGIRPAGGCMAPASDLVCGNGMPALLGTTLDAGTYFVIVEAPTYPGEYSLVAYLAAP